MNKNIAAICLMLLSALGAPTVVEEITDTTPAPHIELVAPDSCEVGELVRLTYPARKVEWKLPGVDYEVSGQRAWISFREPGTYQIIVSGVVEHDVRLVAKDIVVKGDKVEVKPAVDTSLTKLVASWCNESGTPVEVARELGDNFIAASATATNTTELMDAISQRNRNTDQTGAQDVLVKIQLWLIDNLTGKDFAAHQSAFDEIGQGLLSYAGTGSSK